MRGAPFKNKFATAPKQKPPEQYLIPAAGETAI
jgi:hypothetical protein